MIKRTMGSRVRYEEIYFLHANQNLAGGVCVKN